MKSYENVLWEPDLFHADGQTDKAKNRFSQFCECT